MLMKLNKKPKTDNDDLRRTNFLLTNTQIIKQVLLNSNNQNFSNSEKYFKPHFKFYKIIDGLLDNNRIHSKINFDINPNLTAIQKNKLLLLLDNESVFSRSKRNLGDSKTKKVDTILINNIPINFRIFTEYN